jgi:hypothetical protein
VAATASGGEIIPPRRNPKAREKPGIMAFDTSATAAEVKITNPNASRLIGLFHFQNSCHEVFHAAAYRRGGRKMRNTRSGSNIIGGTPGIRLIRSPLITNNIGYDSFSLLLIIVITAMPNNSEITRNNWFCNICSI